MNAFKQKYNVDKITSKWEYPLEGFIPDHNLAKPILSLNQDEEPISKISDELRPELSYGEVLLAHETDKKSADKIMNDGFNSKNIDETRSIRDNAIFGWLNKSDIGYYQSNINERSNHIVLFKSMAKHIFVSSFNLARELYLGDMKRWEYEKKNILKYKDYKKILIKGQLEHIGYKPTSSILSKTV